MLREGWNFHGDIAIALEDIASRHYGDIMTPMGKIYDAASIEHGSFVEVMIMLLRDEMGLDDGIDELDEFERDCAPYFNANGNTIPKETAQELFDRFKALYE